MQKQLIIAMMSIGSIKKGNLLVTIIFITQLFYSIISFAQPGFAWAISAGNTMQERCEDIAIDQNSNVYSIGKNTNTVDFDPGIGVSNLSSGAYLQKLDSNGNFIWVRKIVPSPSNVAYGHSVALDNSGLNVYSTGYYEVATNRSVFVSKLDNNGTQIWSKTFDGLGDDRGESIAVNSLDEVYIAGMFQDSMVVNPTEPTEVTLYGKSGWNIFLVKLDANGDYLWSQVLRSHIVLSDPALDIYIDVNDNVHFAGGFYGIVDFDPSATSLNIASKGNRDIFIQKLDRFGNLIWVKTIGSTYNDFAESVVVDSQGNVVVTGKYNDYTSSINVDFDPGPGTFNLNGAKYAFVLKLDSNGDFVWAGKMGAWSGNFSGRSVKIDGFDNIYVLSKGSGTVNTNIMGSTSYNVSSTGLIVKKLSPTGSLHWAFTSGGSIYSYGLAVTNYAVYINGTFSGTADFDPGPGTYNLTSAGQYDMYVQKLLHPSVLPIKLFSYDISCNNNFPQLNWSTASEINNDYFTIEKSVDALDWEIVTYIQGAGNSNQQINYSYIDDSYKNNNQTTYYRLKQTDFDGKYEYFNILPIKCEGALNTSPIIFPNPATSTLTISGKEINKIEIIDLLGRIVKQVNSNLNAMNIDISNLSNGTYVIKIYETDKISNHKFIKQ